MGGLCAITSKQLCTANITTTVETACARRMTYVLNFGSNCSMKNMAIGRSCHFCSPCCPCRVHRRPQPLLSTLNLGRALKSFRVGRAEVFKPGLSIPWISKGEGSTRAALSTPRKILPLAFILVINDIVQMNKTVRVQSNNAEE